MDVVERACAAAWLRVGIGSSCCSYGAFKLRELCNIVESGATASTTTEDVGDNLELSSQPDNPRSDDRQGQGGRMTQETSQHRG